MVPRLRPVAVLVAAACTVVTLLTVSGASNLDLHRTSSPAALAVPSQVPAAGTTSAVSTVGVLAPSFGRCSATVVTSASESLLVTAAHCVYTEGKWQLDDLRFYPGYHDGQTPYGVWETESAWVPEAWKQGDGQRGATGGTPEHDFAFVHLRRNADGQTAQSVLGSEGIRFNLQPGERQTMLGYPAEGKYDGEHQYRCTSDTAAAASGDGSMTISCDFSGGGSGSAWLSGGAAGTGTARVGAVLSMSGSHGTNYGVPLDGEAQRLYETADRG